MAGSACDRQCVVDPITAPFDGDGCCLPGSTASDDADCGICGDGIIGPGETCDPPDSCLSRKSCQASAVCTVAVFSGDPRKCTASCEVQTVTDCMDGDGCCPAGCSAGDDSDCQDSCGNGVLDKDRGETCEPSDPRAQCVTSCDDGDPCTEDLLKGKPDHCNVRCAHRVITELLDGDDCCPAGADTSTDADCAACGGAGATGTCNSTGNGGVGSGSSGAGTANGASPGTAGATQCRALLTSSVAPASDECSQCICDRCLDEMLGCYASSDDLRNARCSAIMVCKQRIQCVGETCYCGSSLSCLPPAGPCANEIEAASGPSISTAACVADPTCANYWSTLYTNCLERSCIQPCRPGLP
jgi:hypothetical protein